MSNPDESFLHQPDEYIYNTSICTFFPIVVEAQNHKWNEILREVAQYKSITKITCYFESEKHLKVGVGAKLNKCTCRFKVTAFG